LREAHRLQRVGAVMVIARQNPKSPAGRIPRDIPVKTTGRGKIRAFLPSLRFFEVNP